MKILGKNLKCLEVSKNLTVPDCVVCRSNKIGAGNGEKKFYFGSRDRMDAFFGGKKTVKCFFLRTDLEAYMSDIKAEYKKPTQPYSGIKDFSKLWNARNDMVAGLDEAIWFDVTQQGQLGGPRGYINSEDNGYNIFRELALPNTSYVMIMKLSGLGNDPVYYWKFFVDYKAIHQRKSLPLVYTYGKKVPSNLVSQFSAAKDCPEIENESAKDSTSKSKREAQKQAKYRDALFEEMPYCPITGITEERLLIASHIKPFECCENEKEGYDPQNGFLLSPLYDKLFDKGFITFTDDRYMLVSNWLSPSNQQKCCLKNNTFYQKLPITEGRLVYLDYHRKHVFKG